SQRVRNGELLGFLDIGADVLKAPAETPAGDARSDTKRNQATEARFYSNRPITNAFPPLVADVLTDHIQKSRAKQRNIDLEKARLVIVTVKPDMRTLFKYDSREEKYEEGGAQNPFAVFIVPFILIMLMFMVVMISATPLMQGVVEEKMQRVAEVLLGSVKPFQLMMGKLLGMTAVSLTVVGIYMVGGLWATYHFGFTEYVSAAILVWFLVYESLAALMYGSLFISVGAACSDMKETQNLLWPVMLLVCLPMFLLGNVLQ